jgi:hypothetical protein
MRARPDSGDWTAGGKSAVTGQLGHDIRERTSRTQDSRGQADRTVDSKQTEKRGQNGQTITSWKGQSGQDILYGICRRGQPGQVILEKTKKNNGQN